MGTASVVVVLALVMAAVGAVNSGEDAFLRSFFAATNGDLWKQGLNWATTGAPCSWFGVLCNGNGDVIAINVTANGLIGRLSSLNFSQVPSLERFDVSSNNLFGTVPLTALLSHPKLVLANLSGNGFTSLTAVPQYVSASLQGVDLSDNRLWCPLPDDVASVSVVTNNTECYRSMSATIHVTPTVAVEEPVPDVPPPPLPIAALQLMTTVAPRLAKGFVASAMAVNASNITVVGFNVTAPGRANVSWVTVSFTSDVTQPQRANLLTRIRTHHPSVVSLRVTEVTVLYEGTSAPTPPEPASPERDVVKDDTNANTTLIIACCVFGVMLLILAGCVVKHRMGVRNEMFMKQQQQFQQLGGADAGAMPPPPGGRMAHPNEQPHYGTV